MAGALRGVVVGTGFGILTHVRAMRRAGIEVAAVVGRDPERTRVRAARMEIPRALTSLDEALALPGVDLVTVATPPHTHLEIVLAALRAGCHVLCEKPFARDAGEAARMLEAAEAAGRVHMLGTEFRFATGQAHATRAVREGRIGDPRLVSFVLNVPVLADPAAAVPDWWSRAEDGGGWLGAFASHVIDQLQNTVGRFTGVMASLQLLADHDWSVEDTYTIQFRTEAGASGVLQSTAGAFGAPLVCSRIYGTRVQLSIEGNRVRVADGSGERLLETPADLVNEPAEPPPADLMTTAYDHLHAGGFDLAPYTRLFRSLAARVADRGARLDPEPATFADGLAVQRVLDAVRRSSAEGRWVSID